MKRTDNFITQKVRLIRRKYLLQVVLFVVPLAAPVLFGMSTASASETLSTYSITSSYSHPAQVTTDNNATWYVETDSAGNNDIGSMTASGTVTDYAVMPSGESSMKITDITTGPDGNVWFDGCAATSPSATAWTVEAGYLSVSTGAVTFYPNTLPAGTVPCSAASGTLPGPIATGPDGYVWYAVNMDSSATPRSSYLYSVNPSTGITAQGWSAYDLYNSFSGIVTGSDGRLWVSNGSSSPGNNVYALTVSAGHETAETSYAAGSEPENIINGPDGNLWFIESGSNEIGKMTTSGSLTSYSPGSGVYPGSLATGPDGAVWFTGYHSSTGEIGRITTSGGVTLYPTAGSYNFPDAITLGPDGAMWFSYNEYATSPGVYSLGRIGY